MFRVLVTDNNEKSLYYNNILTMSFTRGRIILSDKNDKNFIMNPSNVSRVQIVKEGDQVDKG